MPDAEDNCPDIANPNQDDFDEDGIGDVCDPDDDNDTLTDDYETNVSHTDPRNPDTDGGGVPDGTEVGRGTNPQDPSDDASHTLTVTVDGQGTVTSSPAGISCPSDCSRTYLGGTVGIVALTAEPSSGWEFSHWSGECDGNSGCSVTMDKDVSVGAVFEPTCDHHTEQFQYIAALTDPDLTGDGTLRFSGAIPWCSDGATTRLTGPPALVGDVPPSDTSTLLSFVGMGFRYKGAAQDPTVTPGPGSGTTKVSLCPSFEVTADFSTLLGVLPSAKVIGGKIWSSLPRRARIRVVETIEEGFFIYVLRLTRNVSTGGDDLYRFLVRAGEEIWDQALEDLVSGELTTVQLDTWTPTLEVTLSPDGRADAFLADPSPNWISERTI